jgi:nitroimidazol reductase NimA-like FMN-containing flavoprotein (pyridoxamine 5'-phosphate oxidase superfamily)
MASRKVVPHVTAVAYASDEDHVYIRTEPGSKKVRNLEENNKVAFIVDESLSEAECSSRRLCQGKLLVKLIHQGI